MYVHLIGCTYSQTNTNITRDVVVYPTGCSGISYKPQNGTKDAESKSCIICKRHGHQTRNCPRLTAEGNQAEYSNVLAAMEPTVYQIWKDKTIATPAERSKWIVGSGASCHITPHCNDLSNTTACRIGVATAKTTMYSTHIGDAELIMTSEDGKPTKVVIKDVLHIPGANFRLLSTESLILVERAFLVMTLEVRLLTIGKIRIELECDGETPFITAAVTNPLTLTHATAASMKTSDTVSPSQLIHMRYGHCHSERIKHLNLPGNQQPISCGDYLTCLLSKPQRASFPKKAVVSVERTMQLDIASYMLSTNALGHIL